MHTRGFMTRTQNKHSYSVLSCRSSISTRMARVRKTKSIPLWSGTVANKKGRAKQCFVCDPSDEKKALAASTMVLNVATHLQHGWDKLCAAHLPE